MKRPNQEEQARKFFLGRGGILRTSEAIRRGIHPRTLYGMRDAGVIVEVSRGLYRLSELPELTDPDLVTISFRVPRAVICLISALAFHGLTDEIPHEVNLALPRDVKSPRLDHPPIRVFRFSGESFKAGIERHDLDGASIKIYGPDKTVADCFKFRNKIGLDVAIDALKRRLRDPGVRTADLLKFARICAVERVMTPYLESLL